MIVSELIHKLKKCPGHLQVGMSAHDNSDYEVAGWVHTLDWMNMSEYDPNFDGSEDKDMISSNPEQYVVLRN